MTDSLRPRILPALLPFYDASPGFDFAHLPQFVESCRQAELAALTEDPSVATEEFTIPGPTGAPLKLRLYSPAAAGDARLPCLIFFHGGGFLFGSVYRQEGLCQLYVKQAGLRVLSVEYRLSPQVTAPAPVEDGYAALCWAASADSAARGIDAAALAVGGISAGGTITAALCQMARDRGGPQIRLQMPLYAGLDDSLSTPSAREIQSPRVWSFAYCRTSWELYLAGADSALPYAVPTRAQDFSGLPPLFSYVGALDPVRDENMLYWQKLLAAGVPVEGHVFPGCYHCFELGTPTAAVSQKALSLSYAALKEHLFSAPDA